MLIIGLDYGNKRTGVAVGDTGTGLCFPSLTFTESGDELIRRVLSFAKAEGAEKIVVGLPTRLNGAGEMGEQETLVRKFIETLRQSTEIPVDSEDERLTTDLVERERRAAGVKRKNFDRDATSAAAMLETYFIRNGWA